LPEARSSWLAAFFRNPRFPNPSPFAYSGYYDYLDTVGVLAALEHVVAEATGNAVEFGCAVRAAQEVYAKAVR
jgi:hypothetical protein